MRLEMLVKKLSGLAVVLLIPVLICVAAWITHVIDCLQDGEWGFLIAGAIAFPIAIVHGIGVWLGAW